MYNYNSSIILQTLAHFATVVLTFTLLFLLFCRDSKVHFNGIDRDVLFIDAAFSRLYYTMMVATTTGLGEISPKSVTAKTLTMLTQVSMLLVVGVPLVRKI